MPGRSRFHVQGDRVTNRLDGDPSGVGTALEVEIKAEWKKNRLEVETKVTGGAKLKEKYEIDEDSGELRVELEFSNSRTRQRFKIKQVYERGEDS